MRFSDVVTTGNILTVTSIIGIVGPAIFILYFKLLRAFKEEQMKYNQWLRGQFEEHTARVEACIHQVPGHPENINPPIE